MEPTVVPAIGWRYITSARRRTIGRRWRDKGALMA
jgi:hypothetical protein